MTPNAIIFVNPNKYFGDKPHSENNKEKLNLSEKWKYLFKLSCNLSAAKLAELMGNLWMEAAECGCCRTPSLSQRDAPSDALR